MEKLYLLKTGDGDVQVEYSLISTLRSENGFENPNFGRSLEEYQNEVLPRLDEEARGINLKEGRVPQTCFILYADETPVGLFKVRHYVNDYQRHHSGHIGFGIKPEFRGKGYGKEGCRLAIEKLKEMPDFHDEVIIMSCSITNQASLKVQRANGATIVEEGNGQYLTHIPLK